MDSRGPFSVHVVVRSIMPKARALIDGASLGPDALKAAGQAFDEAWAEIAGHISNDPTQIEATRMLLANAVLSVADDSSREVAVLKKAALDVMARNCSSISLKQKTNAP